MTPWVLYNLPCKLIILTCNVPVLIMIIIVIILIINNGDLTRRTVQSELNN